MVEGIPKYSCGDSGKCPHCGVHVRFEEARTSDKSGSPFFMMEEPLRILNYDNTTIVIYSSNCPHCGKPVVSVHTHQGSGTQFSHLAHPRNRTRSVPESVPGMLRKDYDESAAVLDISEQASAALSRRCLQSMLNDQGFKKDRLSDCIDDALPTLPAYISAPLDTIRAVGNYGAHAMKSESSGSIIQVEPGEAEFSLDILDMLFDHYYVRPAINKAKVDGVNTKLKSAGRKPLKSPSGNE